MKVLIVYKKFNEIGGSELQLSILINALIHNGNEIQLFTTNFNNKLFNNIDINRIDLIIKRNLFFPLFRIISRLNPSLIFTRDTRHLYKYILISKLFKIPVVYNVNQNISLLPQNFFQLIRQILPDTLKLSFPYWALEGFFSIKTLKFVDAIITQTYDQSAYLKKRGIYSTMIRNSIVINNNKYIKPNKKIVVWVANIKKMKNIEDFIKLSHFINEHLEFVCVGRLPGNSQYRATIENLIKTSQVQYKGELSYNETAELISRSYILVNTSYNEGFPNTFIQAWSFGVPVISLNIDPDKIIMQNKIGLFSGTFEKMVDDTLFLINNKEEWGKMSLNAYQFARSNFDIKENLKSYIKSV